MHGQVPIAQAEPGRSSQLIQRIQKIPCLVGAAPARLAVRNPRQGIDHCIQVRTDAESQVVEVVRRIDDHRQVLRGQAPGQPIGQLGPADSPCKSNNFHRQCTT